MLRASTALFILVILLAAATAANAQEDCEITFGEAGISRTFSLLENGEIINDLEGGWSFIRGTRGPCTFHVFNDPNLSGRSAVYGTNIEGGRIRAGATGGQDSGGWRARSVHIRRTFDAVSDAPCFVILGDSGISQTFYGPDQVENISGWLFIRQSCCDCTLIVFDGDNFDGTQEEFLADITGRTSFTGRIDSLTLSE